MTRPEVVCDLEGLVLADWSEWLPRCPRPLSCAQKLEERAFPAFPPKALESSERPVIQNPVSKHSLALAVCLYQSDVLFCTGKAWWRRQKEGDDPYLIVSAAETDSL